MLKRTLSLFTLVVMLLTLLAACGSAPAATAPTTAPAPTTAAATAAPAPTEAASAATTAPAATAAPAATDAPAAEPTAAPTNTPVAVDVFDQAAAGNRVVVQWYVGLGTGTQPAQIEPEQKVVKAFNDSQDKIYLRLTIVDNTQAFNNLATQIAAGNPPDIIGPVGVRARNAFKGQLLDLSDLIKANNVDLSQYDESLVNYYNVEGQGQIGLPYAIYPSFIYYNKDLFDEAGLPYPPQKFGEKYDGKDWNMETLRELALKLTVDDQGKDATEEGFNPDKIVQFGFNMQWGTDPRAQAAFFSPGSLVAADGKAQIPAAWTTAWKWIYDGMFKDHFIPSDAYANSDVFGNGNVFNSGRNAMAFTHLWYTCCIDAGKNVKNWDIAVVPSFEGKTTAKLHADTFSIMKATKNPNEAFQVLQYLLKDPTLISTYGALPAEKNKQADFLSALDTKFAPNKANWQVALDSLAYVDDPSHEEDLPNFLKSQDTIAAFGTLMRSKPGIDVDAEIKNLQTALDGIFAEAKQ